MSNQFIDNIDRRTQLAGFNRLALLLFTLDEAAVYGINVFKVAEVIPMPPLTPVPGSHMHVLGLASVRGRMIPVIDLRRAIGGSAVGDAPYLIVTEFNRRIQGFCVTGVRRIVNVDVAEVAPPPQQTADDDYLTAVTRVDERLVQIIDVERVLADVIGATSELSDAYAQRGAGRQWRVLVADDSKVARMQIARTLEQLGVEPVLVNDGRAALRALQSMAGSGSLLEQDVLMVISDIEMPDMDGYTLATEIRRDSALADTFVVLHTSLSGVFNHAMVERVGADRFVPKFHADDLAAQVLERLRAVESAAAGELAMTG